MASARDTAATASPLGAQSEQDDAGTSSLLRMQGIVKRYGTNTALSGVDFDVRAGEIHALLGENGAGKSTLMHVLSGLTRPDAGTIALAGQRIVLNSPRNARQHGIAMVHQHFTLVPAFTVAENLALDTPPQTGMGNLVRSYTPAKIADAALSHARELGWNLDPAAVVRDLSVGVQQRVEIIKALATNARILIFDEPTAVLAADEVDELFAVLRKLRDSGCAVILIAHKLAEILAVSDRVTVLRRGSRVASVVTAETDATQLAAWMVGETAAPAAIETELKTALPDNSEHPLVFSAQNLQVRGDRRETVLNGLSLSVRAGEIFGIGGVDGNGQKELAEALIGLRRLAGGSIHWKDGEFAPGKTVRVAYIPQDRRHDGLAVTLSIEENLLFDAVRERMYRRGPLLKRRALRELAKQLVREFDIRTKNRLLPASSLSGGNQQKIILARTFRANPDWLVVMNPTRGLDIGATRFVHSQLCAARARGAAIVLISTDWDELRVLADRAAILANGILTEFDLRSEENSRLGLLLGGVTPAVKTESPHP